MQTPSLNPDEIEAVGNPSEGIPNDSLISEEGDYFT